MLLLFAFFLHQKKIWKATFLGSTKDGLSLIVQISLLAWSLISVVIGLFYLLANANSDLSFQSLIILGIPLVVLITYIGKIMVSNLQSKQEVHELSRINKELSNWISLFPFVDKKNVRFSLYTSRGRVVGRITIQDVDREQALTINERKNELPKDVFLDIITSDGEDIILH